MRRLPCLPFVLLALFACKSAPPPAPPPSLDDLARGAVHTFVRCYERDGAECRPASAPVKEWAALRMLALVRDAIPTEILDELPAALESLRDEGRVRKTFIRELADNESWVRTAHCEVDSVLAVGDSAVALADAAGQRIEALGLGQTAIGQMVAHLAETARAVGQARIVGSRCLGERSLYIAVAPDERGAWQAVAILSSFPTWLRRPTPPDAARVTLPSGPNLVDAWLPVYEEQL